GRFWDLLVVGGGIAGLVGAQIAAGFGALVLLVESVWIGGECLWIGCVLSKVLFAAVHAAADARFANRFGVAVQGVTVDFFAVMAHVQRAVDTIASVDSPEVLEAAGV